MSIGSGWRPRIDPFDEEQGRLNAGRQNMEIKSMSKYISLSSEKRSMTEHIGCVTSSGAKASSSAVQANFCPYVKQSMATKRTNGKRLC